MRSNVPRKRHREMEMTTLSLLIVAGSAAMRALNGFGKVVAVCTWTPVSRGPEDFLAPRLF